MVPAVNKIQRKETVARRCSSKLCVLKNFANYLGSTCVGISL